MKKFELGEVVLAEWIKAQNKKSNAYFLTFNKSTL